MTTTHSAQPYLPIYVTPYAVQGAPPPPVSRTAIYTLAHPPLFLLEVGTPVHLHFLYAASRGRHPHKVDDSVIVPLPIRGRIAGERARTDDGVEFVVRNEDQNAPVQRAFIRFRFHPGSLPIPRLGDLVAQRLDERNQRSGASAGEWDRPGNDAEPVMWPNSYLPLPPLHPLHEAVRRESVRFPTTSEPAPPMVDLTDVRGLRRPDLPAAQPYSMWEPYGATATIRPTKADADAIRNYGCPIIISTREQSETSRRLPQGPWRYADSMGEGRDSRSRQTGA